MFFLLRFFGIFFRFFSHFFAYFCQFFWVHFFQIPLEFLRISIFSQFFCPFFFLIFFHEFLEIFAEFLGVFFCQKAVGGAHLHFSIPLFFPPKNITPEKHEGAHLLLLFGKKNTQKFGKNL